MWCRPFHSSETGASSIRRSSAACQRPDRCVFPVKSKLKGNAVGNVLKSLLKKGLIEEVPTKSRDDTVWRHDEQHGRMTLVATEAGFAALGIDQPVFLLEIELAEVLEGVLPKFSELSRFPEVRRDLALLVDRSTPAEAVLSAAREAAGEHLRNLTLFDVYQGKGIDPQRKSLALGLTFQHSSRTLTEDEVNTTVDAVVGVLKERLAATLRN